MPEYEMPPSLQVGPFDIIAWGEGSTYEDLLSLWSDDPRPEDEYMSQVAVNISVLHRAIQKHLLEAEAAMTEGRWSGVQAILNHLGGICWVVRELKYMNDEEMEPYRTKLKELREKAQMYQDQGL